MNNLLLEQIKRLISETTAGEFFTDMQDGSRTFSGRDRGLKDDDPLSDPEEAKKAARRKARGFILDQLNRFTKKKTGKNGKIIKYILNYDSKLDKNDWVPRLVTFHDERVKNKSGETVNIEVTPQTYKFLQNLLKNLLDTEKDVVSETTKEKISGLSISFEEIENSNGNITEILDSVDDNFNAGIGRLKEIVLNDKRFNPKDFVLKIRAPIHGYTEEQLEQIGQLYDKATSLTDISNIKTSINNLYVDIDITINTTATLLPLYNNVNFAPKNSNSGALEKLAWSYQQLRQMTQDVAKNSETNILNSIEPAKILHVIKRYYDGSLPDDINSAEDAKKIIDLIDNKNILRAIESNTISDRFRKEIVTKIKEEYEGTPQANDKNFINNLVDETIKREKADDKEFLTRIKTLMGRILPLNDKIRKGANTFVNRIQVDDATNEDAMSIGPLGLLAKGKRIIERNEPNSIIVITSDVGMGYIWVPPTFGNERGDFLKTFRITKDGADTKYGKLIKDFFEGLISKERFLYEIELMDLSPDQRAIAEKFNDTYINRTYTRIYCFKLMYCNAVTATYNMPLPASVFDTQVGRQQMPKSIKVPGSENLPRTKSYVTTTKKTFDGTENTSKLTTVSEDLLKVGSGSLSFLSAMKHIGDLGGPTNNFEEKNQFITNVFWLHTVFVNLVFEFYAYLTEEQFNELKAGNTITIKGDDENDIDLDPNDNKSLKAIIDSMDKYNPQIAYVLKYDKFGFNVAESHLKSLQKIYSQILRQMDSIGFNESEEGRKLLNDIQTGFNTSIAGRPGTVSKIQNDMILSIKGSDSFERNISDAIVENNLLRDAFPIIRSYFESFHGDDAEDAQNTSDTNDALIPELITSTTMDGLNIPGTRKGVHINERNSLISQLNDYINDGKIKITSFFAGTEEKQHIDAIVSIIKSYRYLFDAIKLLDKVTAYDGVRMFEYQNIENVNTLSPAWLSEINTKLKLHEIDDSTNLKNTVEEAVKTALETATEADVKSGISTSTYCRENFRPLIDKVREMINLSPSKKMPIAITPYKSNIPYTPIHTIITAIKNKDNIVFCIVSSVLSIKETASPYNYIYDKKTKEFKVKPNEITKKIEVESEDKDFVQDHVGQADYAFCMFNMMSAKKTTDLTLNSFSNLEKRASIGYRDLKRYIEENNIFSDISNMSDIKESDIDNLIKQSVNETADTPQSVNSVIKFSRIRNIIDIIAKYIVVTAILYDIQNENDMEI